MELFKSRRFWLLMLDTAISIALHFWGGEDVKFLITTLQPVFILVILVYTADNSIKAFFARK
jgi:hypothetical protein